jgi:hypothetical protein
MPALSGCDNDLGIAFKYRCNSLMKPMTTSFFIGRVNPQEKTNGEHVHKIDVGRQRNCGCRPTK